MCQTPSVARMHAPMHSNRAVSFVFLYKLIDVAAWVKYETSPVVTIQRTRGPVIDIPVRAVYRLQLYSIHLFQDWDLLTGNCFQFIRQASNVAHHRLSSLPIPQSSLSKGSADDLLFGLYSLGSKMHSVKLLANVQVACLHLGHLLKVLHCF